MLHAGGLESAEFICSKEEWKESRAARNDTQLGGSKSREFETIHTTITLKASERLKIGSVRERSRAGVSFHAPACTQHEKIPVKRIMKNLL